MMMKEKMPENVTFYDQRLKEGYQKYRRKFLGKRLKHFGNFGGVVEVFRMAAYEISAPGGTFARYATAFSPLYASSFLLDHTLHHSFSSKFTGNSTEWPLL